MTAESLLAAAHSLAKAIAPTASQRDRDGELPFEPARLLRSSGLLAARVPAAFGGPDADFVTLARIVTQVSLADPNVGQLLLPHFGTLERIRQMTPGTPKAALLEKVLAGSLLSAAIAERGGRFRTDIRTRLTEHQDGFRLDGQKFYATGSLLADALRVVALDAAKRVVHVIVPVDRPGVRIENDWDGMGQRTTASGTVVFENVRVDADEILRGPFSATEARSYGSTAGQLLHCAVDAGIALAALNDASAWALDGARPVRESGVTRSADDPFVQHAIGDIATRAHCAEAIVDRAAARVDQAARLAETTPTAGPEIEKSTIEAAMAVAEARIVTAAAALRSAELLFEVGGASATSRSRNFDRHWRNARTHTTHDPVAYKYKVLGDFHLNGTAPPNALYY